MPIFRNFHLPTLRLFSLSLSLSLSISHSLFPSWLILQLQLSLGYQCLNVIANSHSSTALLRGAMDSSFHSYHCHLAEMTTDQRELEHFSVQTGLPGTDGFLQTSPSQLYDPWPLTKSWPASRSTLVSQSTIPPQPLGYTDTWDATMSEPYNATSSHLRELAPDNHYSFPYNSASSTDMTSMVSSLATMEQPSLKHPKRRGDDDLFDWQTRLLPSPCLDQQTYYQSTMIGHNDTFNPTRAVSPSPPNSISSCPSSSQSPESVSTGATTITGEDNSPQTSFGGDSSEEESISDLPYSQLIFQALMSAEGYRMPLQEIYNWFEEHTNKGKDPSCKGWQNSIRHNLSMNAVSTQPSLTILTVDFDCASLFHIPVFV